jgi:hypothetical protein
MRSYTSGFPDALRRTIVGRTYYATFLMLRDELGLALKGSRYEALYDSISQKGVIHSLVWKALRMIDDGHLASVLYQMRRRREQADYRMLAIRKWEKEIEDIFLEAEEILRSRSTLGPGFSREIADIEDLVLKTHSKIARIS